MRGPLETDVIDDLGQTNSLLDLNLAQITRVLASSRLLELDDKTRFDLGGFAKTLHNVGEFASRATNLIGRTNADAKENLDLEWNLQHQRADGITSCRSPSGKARAGIRAGATFHVDNFWQAENGVPIGVTWRAQTRPLEKLTPPEMKAWTRPLPKDRGASVHG